MAKKLNIPTNNSRTAETIAGILDPVEQIENRQEIIKKQLEENRKARGETQEAEPMRRSRRRSDLIRDNSVQNGLTADYTRATVIVNKADFEELKNIAYTDRTPIKDILEKVIKDYLAQYKKENKDKEILKRK